MKNITKTQSAPGVGDVEAVASGLAVGPVLTSNANPEQLRERLKGFTQLSKTIINPKNLVPGSMIFATIVGAELGKPHPQYGRQCLLALRNEAGTEALLPVTASILRQLDPVSYTTDNDGVTTKCKADETLGRLQKLVGSEIALEYLGIVKPKDAKKGAKGVRKFNVYLRRAAAPAPKAKGKK